MIKVWCRYLAIACLAAVAILAGNPLHGPTRAHAQGIDLGLPNPLLDGSTLAQPEPEPIFSPVPTAEPTQKKRLPDPTHASPAGPLYTRPWAYELQQIDEIGRNSICDRAAWERGRIRLQVLKEKARNELELHQHNIRVEKPAFKSLLARFLSRIQTTDFTIFDEADLELWAWEATARKDYIAIEAYAYPPFRCDKAYHLQSGVGQRLVAPSSTAALTPFAPVGANVAYDGQAYCTFGKADPAKIALAPADDSGNPLSGRMLASLPLMAPGGPKVPAKGGNNPENPPKVDKPQGGNTSTPEGPTTATPRGGGKPEGSPQGSPSAGSEPAASGGNSSGSDTVPQPEKPTAKSGSSDLGAALDILTGGEGKAGMSEITPPPAPPEGPASGKSVLDNIDALLEIFERERNSGKTATPGGTAPLGLGPLPPDLSQAGVTSKGSGEYAPSPGASLEPQIDPNASTPAWDRPNAWPTELPKPADPKTATPQNGSTSAPQEPLSPPVGGQKPITGTSSLPGAASGAALAEILAGRDSPTHGGSSSGALFGPPVSQESHVDRPLLSEQDPPAGSKEGAAPGQPAELQNKSGGKPESAGKTQTSVTSASKEKQPIEKSSAATPVSALSSNPNSAYAGNITIHFKATESVLTAGSHGPEVKTQIAKLVPLETPDLPKTGRNNTEKAALDVGHDASPVTCVLGKDGKCKAQVSGNQREIYGLPANGVLNYAAELNLKENTGGLLEGTSPAAGDSTKPNAGLPNVPAGVQMTTSTFKIGGQTFTRFSVASADPALAAGFLAALARTFGAKFAIDRCGEKQPGPPLGMEPVSYSALGRQLPQAALNLRATVSPAGDAR